MKKLIIILITAIVIVVSILVGILIYLQDSNKPEEQPLELTQEELVNNAIQEVTQEGIFFRVKRCIDLYIGAANDIATEDEEEQYDLDFEFDEENDLSTSQTMLDLLGNEYKDEFQITESNVKDKYMNGQKESLLTLLHVYKADNTMSVTTYFAYGMIRDIRNNTVEGISLMVVIDDKNDTFAIYPAEYMQSHGFDKMELGQQLELDNIEGIQKNNSNETTYVYMSAEKLIQTYFDAYKELALYNKEEAYNMLNAEYKERRFLNFDEYNDYIQKNYSKMLGMSLAKYTTEYDGDTTKYICIDKNGKYYIFTEHGAMDFEVQLDIYTLDTTEFLTKYNAGNYKERVILNLNKVQEAVNDGNYRYVYNHLDETFKQNNFATFEAFSIYMQEHYFANNSFTFDSYQEAGEVASCTVKITNGDNTAESREQTFIMKLGEGTDFVMSFQI